MNVDNDMVLYIILGMFAFFFILKVMGGDGGGNNNNNQQQNRGYNDEKVKKYRQLEKENITLETMKIKKEEVENEIDKLKLEASMNFEKEAENETKIKKLELQVKQLNIKILKKEFNITNQIKTEKVVINEDLEKIEKERKIIAEKLISGIIDDDIYKEMIMSYMKKKKKLEERLNLLTDDNKNINTLIIKGVELFRNIYFIYKKSIPCEKSIVLKGLQVELF